MNIIYKMKEYFKSQLKNIPMMIILIVLFYGIKVIADSYAITSTEVSFDNSGTNITATNMQNAINETFLHATDYNEIKTTIGNSTLTTTSQTLTGAINELDDHIAIKNVTMTVNTTYVTANSLDYTSAVQSGNVISVNFPCLAKVNIPTNGWYNIGTISKKPVHDVMNVVLDGSIGLIRGQAIIQASTGNINVFLETTIPQGDWISTYFTYITNDG